MTKNSFIRVFLDGLYRISGGFAAFFLLCILGLVLLQMTARWSGEVLIGAPDYTGYCMAAASFLALAYSLNSGTHIRVNLFITLLGKYRKYGEVWCFAVATFFTWFFAYYAIKLTYESYRFNDISQGQDAAPLWIPQVGMCIGVVIFAISMLDNLVSLAFFDKDNIDDDEAAGH